MEKHLFYFKSVNSINEPALKLELLPGIEYMGSELSPVTFFDTPEYALLHNDIVIIKEKNFFILYNIKTGRIIGTGEELFLILDRPEVKKVCAPADVVTLINIEKETSDFLLSDTISGVSVGFSIIAYSIFPKNIYTNFDFSIFQDRKSLIINNFFIRNECFYIGNEIDLILSSDFFKNFKIKEKSKPDLNLHESDDIITSTVEIIEKYTGFVVKNRFGIIEDTDPEFLHDYRVNIRKIRSYLSDITGYIENKDLNEMKKIFRGMIKRTNRLRDLDVLIMDIREYMNEFENECFTELMDLVKEQRETESAKVIEGLKKIKSREELYRTTVLVDRIKNIKVSEELNTVDFANEVLHSTVREILKLTEDLNEESTDSDIHEVRLAYKKIRYLLEIFNNLDSLIVSKDVFKDLKKVQDLLGKFNDFSVQIENLKKLVTGEIKPGSALMEQAELLSSHLEKDKSRLKTDIISESETIKDSFLYREFQELLSIDLQ